MDSHNRYKGPDGKAVRSAAQGRWLEIFQALVPALGPAIANLGRHVRCPFHGGEGDFRLIAGRPGHPSTAATGTAFCTCGVYRNGFDVIMRALNTNYDGAVRMVDEVLNGTSIKASPVPDPEPRLSEEERRELAEKLHRRLAALWNRHKSLDPLVTPGLLQHVPYLCARGIAPATLEGVKSLRYIPELAYYQWVDGKPEKIGAWPAQLGLMRDENGTPVAIHRTWLTADRRAKAPVEKPKKLTQAIDSRGAAIRLFDLDERGVLGVAEGIETALAAKELSVTGNFGKELAGLPVWAASSSAGMLNFRLPVGGVAVRKLVFFADNDANGTSLKAIKQAITRLKGEHQTLEIEVHTPPVVGEDWLDVLVRKKRDMPSPHMELQAA